MQQTIIIRSLDDPRPRVNVLCFVLSASYSVRSYFARIEERTCQLVSYGRLGVYLSDWILDWLSTAANFSKIPQSVATKSMTNHTARFRSWKSVVLVELSISSQTRRQQTDWYHSGYCIVVACQYWECIREEFLYVQTSLRKKKHKMHINAQLL